MTILCVLRSGGAYSPRWVDALARGIELHSPSQRDAITCLTDMEVTTPGVRVLPLRFGWPGWWSKLEAFAPGVTEGPTCYVDLDTLVVGELAPFESYGGPFAMLSDFFKPSDAESGVMAWVPGPMSEQVWSAFLKDPWANIHRYRRDGRFIAEHAAGADRLQELYPKKIVSLKVHARKACPAGASLCCGHGRPRFSEPEAGWAHHQWLGLVAEGVGPRPRIRSLAVGSRERSPLDDPDGDYLPPRTR